MFSMASLITDTKTIITVFERRLHRTAQGELAILPAQTGAIARVTRGKRMSFYLGIDATGPDLHLGHTIPLLFLKDIARLGHEAIVLIGDFTTQIGDPTGKEAARKALSQEEIERNARTYREQIAKIFGDVPFTMKHNSEWLRKLDLTDFIRLASRVTVQQLIVREMFQERMKRERPIYLNEFLYPLLQGYDSVAMRVDGEVGGNDQTFNMLIGRELEREYLGKDKLVFATRLLVDTESGVKMSKSEGNFIALNDEPQEIRRKVLNTIPDEMTKTLFELCTEKEQEWINEHAQGDARQFKEELAEELVRMYHGDAAMEEARQPKIFEVKEGKMSLVLVLKGAGVAKSVSEAKRLITQKAVTVNGTTATQWDQEIRTGDQVRVGPGKFIRIVD